MQDWLVDTEAGAVDKLDGTLVGWLDPSMMTAPRPEPSTNAETDPAIRGPWAAVLTGSIVGDDGTSLGPGPVGVEIGRTSITFDLGNGRYWPLRASPTGTDTVEVAGMTPAFGCPPTASGTYRWSTADGQIAFEAVSEACRARAELFTRPLELVLPPSGTSSRTAFAGRRYAAPSFVWPFHVTIPSSGQADVPWSDARIVEMQSMSASPMNMIAIEHARAGLADPCQPTGATIPISPGLDGIRAYVEGLTDQGLTVAPFVETEVGGRPALMTEIGFPDGCSDYQSLFDETSENGWSPMGDHVRVWLLAADDGSHVAITEGPEISPSPWMDELLASLSWDDTP
jgi:hypothetical protein